MIIDIGRYLVSYTKHLFGSDHGVQQKLCALFYIILHRYDYNLYLNQSCMCNGHTAMNHYQRSCYWDGFTSLHIFYHGMWPLFRIQSKQPYGNHPSFLRALCGSLPLIMWSHRYGSTLQVAAKILDLCKSPRNVPNLFHMFLLSFSGKGLCIFTQLAKVSSVRKKQQQHIILIKQRLLKP